MTDLATSLVRKKCAPCEGGVAPLTPEQIRPMLKGLPGWSLDGPAITRTYKFANYHERETREHFPQFALADLNKAMHVVLPSNQARTGYDGFAVLAWHLPVLWVAAPLLKLPGISHAGRLVYARIAKSRHNCTDETCSHR